jgi:hypothetical protein
MPLFHLVTAAGGLMVSKLAPIEKHDIVPPNEKHLSIKIILVVKCT